MIIKTAQFVKSGTKPEHYPVDGLPEIAFAGRSNVGKSSLINSLCGRKKLVRISNTPGRTQLLNFFMVNDELSFVDLPGYGYAKVSKKERSAWGRMIETYLAEREDLLAVVCVFDSRRGMDENDRLLVEAAPHFGWQPIIVFTKADKFKNNARLNRQHELAKEVGVGIDDILMYSSVTGLGRDEVWSRICEVTGISTGENSDDEPSDDETDA